MESVKIRGINVTSISCSLSRNNVSILDFVPNLVNKENIERTIKVTGFSSLSIVSPDIMTSDLCVAAAESVLVKIDRHSIGGIVLVTQSPDYNVPATSHVLQHRLGLNNDILCLDINEGCSGWVSGLYTASIISRNLLKPVLLLCGDTSSKLTSPNDRATRIIFGDSASATLVEPGEKEMQFIFKSYGEDADVISLVNHFPNDEENKGKSKYMTLNGGKILEFSLKEVPEAIDSMLISNKMNKDDVSLFACHQANRLIVNSLADKLGIPHNKMPFVSETIGNESSSSIPFVLSAMAKNCNYNNVLCCGFGTGLSIGVCMLNLSETIIGKTIYI